jgi:arginine/lysine/ornithine decarboxylase
MVSAGLIVPYPPGIPLACPGEVLTEELLTYVTDLRKRGEKVIGIDENMNIRVGM